MVQETWEPSVAAPTGTTPLRRFRAKLSGISHKDGEGSDQATGRSWTYRNVIFDFTELEVLESSEVYPFPVAQIGIRYADPSSSRGGTPWAAFSESVRQLLGTTASLNELKGKVQEWGMGPCKLRQRGEDGQWAEVDGEAFKVISVEGAGDVAAAQEDLMEVVLKLLNGKSEKDFNEEAFKNELIRGNSELVDRIVNRKLLPELEKAGKAKADAEGIWHVS